MLEEEDQIFHYLEQHSEPETEVLARLRRETHLKMVNARMLSGHIQGRILSFIAKLVKPRKILEIGTFTGYATICLAEGLVENGTVHTIEVNEELEDIAKKFFKEAGILEKVNYHLGDAVEVLKTFEKDAFDLIFLDADKVRYPQYLPVILELLRSGGVLIADNVLWSGKVLEPVQDNDLDTQGIVRFNEMIKENANLEKVMISLRDGLFLIRKK